MSYNITCKKGDTFPGVTFAIQRNSVDVDIVSARMQIRKRAASETAELTLTTDNGKLEISDNDVIIKQQIISIDADDYVYDIEITLDTGEIKTWISGTFTVVQDVTRIEA